jgi:hypothetical protein
MRVYLIELRKSVRQLRQHGFGTAAVHLTDAPLKGINEAFGHPVRLRTAYRHVDRLDPQLSGNRMHILRQLRTAIMTEEFLGSGFASTLPERVFTASISVSRHKLGPLIFGANADCRKYSNKIQFS